MVKTCIRCGKLIPEGRLKILPKTETCVEHSDIEKKVGTPITYGEGDHTYVELNIMDAKDYKRIEKSRQTSRSTEFGL